MKLCKDCKHCVIDQEWIDKHRDENNSVRFSRCRLTLNKNHESRFVGYDPGLDDMRFCFSQRITGWLGARIEKECGREGRFFEPKS